MAGQWKSKQIIANIIVLFVLWIATLLALIVVVAVYEANEESVIRDILPMLPTQEKQTNLNAQTDTSGIIGSRGEKGEKGKIGPPGMGIKGEPGQYGNGGPPGELGHDGIPGGNGPQGMPGEKGQKGDDGTIGRPGEDGETAISGLNGTKGEPATAVVEKIELLEQEYAILNTTIQETEAKVELLISHLKSIDETFNPELVGQGKQETTTTSVRNCDGNAPCQSDYVCNPYSETCFIKIHTNKTWDDAKQFCEGRDEHMAILDSEESIHWFKNMTKNYSEWQTTEHTWIGGRKNSSNVWTWDGREDKEIVFTDWWPGEPNGSGPCMQIYKSSTWDDVGCSWEQQFFCERMP